MIEIVSYRPDYEPGIRELCRIPVSGNILLALERDPTYFTGARVQAEKPEVYVCIEPASKQVWAVMNVGLRRVWYNNEIKEVRYMSDLRIHPDKQNGPILFLLIRHFKKVTAEDVLPAQTVVFSDNFKMLDLIEKASHKTLRAIPKYNYAGKLVTYLLLPGKTDEHKSAVVIRRANKDDIGPMQEFFNQESSKINYYPYYEFARLNTKYYEGIDVEDYFLAIKKDQIVGLVGVWDQSQFKQTRVVGYRRILAVMRPIFNTITKVLYKKKLLPPPGSLIKNLNLHCILINENNADVFDKLLSRIKNEYQNLEFDYLLCCMSLDHPLTKVLEKHNPARKIQGNYYYVTQQNTPGFTPGDTIYVEAARI